MKQEYTLTLYTEDKTGLINKIAIMFLRKKIALESLNVSTCEITKMYRFTVVIRTSPEVVHNLVLQLEKIIDVFKCYYNTNEEIIFGHLCFLKIPTAAVTDNEPIEIVLRKMGARAISIDKHFMIFEVSGHEKELDDLYILLKQNDMIVEFIKSSRIALSKSGQGFKDEAK
ncbi:acetolactate synthase small subunit [Flavobacterium cupreum]|uniref:Acetolactate synthase small subunit n=1 Tax=Flavobacterium cupreum TaxID=2133766 RepID=A0A434ADI2_9FLAO|nr:acetolactate synthase small subunit [Flavobacterium cupreum]RUT72442.1 acetolactate synthase small subunit [Flavobacterium cupreum]